MTQLFSNAARGYLSANIGEADTSVMLAGLGNLFEPVTAPDFFKAVLQDVAGFEIVYCIAHSAGSNSFTIQRGQEGTVARAFAANSVFGQRVTAADMEALMFVYQPKTISSNTTLDANTEYVTGSGLRILNGANLRIPVSTKLEVKAIGFGKNL